MAAETGAAPIRTELYRFLSLRSPQLIEVERKEFGFVKHPSRKASHFLRGLEDLSASAQQEALAKRAGTFDPLTSRHAVRAIAPALYDFAQQLYASRARERSLEDLKAIDKLGTPDDDVILQLWDNVFYQLLERRNVAAHQACTQLLVAHHFIVTVRQPRFLDRIKALAKDVYPRRIATGDAALAQWLQRLSHARLLIPDVFSVRKHTGKGGGTAAGVGAAVATHGVYQLGLGVFRRVEQEVCCYVPGEVSHIENILAREYKERSTRSLTSSEVTTEESTEAEQEQTSDTSTTQRNEMQSAVATILDQSSETGFGATTSVNGTIGTTSVGATASFDYGTANSLSVSETEALTQAQDITQQAVSRVAQRTAVKRVSRMLQEFEENNRHGFDNREGDQHVTGIYRWLDIIYVNRIINYGMRQMVEFVIPDPARFYVKSIQNADKEKKPGGGAKDQGPRPKPPRTLEDEGITGPENIGRRTETHQPRDGAPVLEKDYNELEQVFDVALPNPPLEQLPMGISLEPADDHAKGTKPRPDGGKETFTFNLNLEPGYRLTGATLNVRFDYHFGSEKGTYMRARMAGRSEIVNRNTKADGKPVLNKKASPNKPLRATLHTDWAYGTNLTQQVTLELDMKNVHDFSVTGSLDLAVSDSVESQWQEGCYRALQDAYDRQYEAYQRDLDQWEKQQEDDGKDAKSSDEEPVFGGSSDANRAIEQREIKRLAIEMIAFPFGHAVGEDHMVVDACKVPSVNQTRKWDDYASHARFYEQAFEWSAMSYSFYPYYWADRCQWADRLQLTAPSDPVFEGFLQAGMARMIVPVRLGFEEAANLYLETGAIWNGADMVIDTEDDLYVSISEELCEPETFIEDKWETRVPTTLTIVQGDSVFLDDKGLPCCGDLAGAHNPLKPRQLRLEGRKA